MAAAIHPVLGKKVARFMHAVAGRRNARAHAAPFYSYAPYAIFAPDAGVRALLKLLYLGIGRRYGEHFLFALHTNAFAFLQLSRC